MYNFDLCRLNVFPMDLQTILIYILGASILVLIGWIIRLERKIRLFTLGTGISNLEELFKSLRTDIKVMNEWKTQSVDMFKQIDGKLEQSVRGVETIRFNPFKGTGVGGNQSFATAFINKKGNGVVFSSLHARDRVSIFSKPLKDFISEYELSEEEKDVIERAKKTL